MLMHWLSISANHLHLELEIAIGRVTIRHVCVCVAPHLVPPFQLRLTQFGQCKMWLSATPGATVGRFGTRDFLHQTLLEHAGYERAGLLVPSGLALGRCDEPARDRSSSFSVQQC
jgi:hypothetical protein